MEKLKKSSTLYIGNLSFYTSESQIYELFSTCGEINRVIMGLNKNTKTPCGFCFVEYNLYKNQQIFYKGRWRKSIKLFKQFFLGQENNTGRLGRRICRGQTIWKGIYGWTKERRVK